MKKKIRVLFKKRFLFLALSLLAAGGAYALLVVKTRPLFQQLEQRTTRRESRQPLRFYGDGREEGGAVVPTLLNQASGQDVDHSRWIPLEQIPPMLESALILCEDRSFYSHHGVHWKGLLRAVWVNLRGGKRRQGGSTLSQQLIKNVFLTPEKTMKRKFKEMALSLALEAHYEKDQILEMYLNHVYLGRNGARGIYGVEEAGRAYFGKSASELNLEECALLVGLIPAPNAYHPRLSPGAAVSRRNLVLDILRKDDVISDAEYLEAVARPMVLTPPASGSLGFYYLSWVHQILEKEFGGEFLDASGYSVYLAMDVDMQRAAENAVKAKNLESALVALDPQTGDVRALVGGRSFITSPYNRAVFSRRQPGSAFKPILFAAALESRAATLATMLEDKPFILDDGGPAWEPKNYDGLYRGQASVREALVQSMNIPSVHLLELTGAQRVTALARDMGVQSPLRPVPSLALGTSEVTLLELTAAYAAFANGGQAVAPRFIRRVEDAEGNVIYTNEPRQTPALSPETASLMTSALQDVVDRGTAKNARTKLGYKSPAAGKTGTSDNFTDAWFVGYTPTLVCGVWRGRDIPSSLGLSSSRLALPVWVKFMKAAERLEPPPPFQLSEDLVEWKIDPETGQRARAGCPKQQVELFLPETRLEKCSVHAGGVSRFFQGLFGKKKKK